MFYYSIKCQKNAVADWVAELVEAVEAWSLT